MIADPINTTGIAANRTERSCPSQGSNQHTVGQVMLGDWCGLFWWGIPGEVWGN